MKIIQSAKEIQQFAKNNKKDGKTIGFVPTMGYLHEGHLALAKQARKENDLVIMSIFVNPLQFGPNEDFDSYPRDVERDQELAKKVGVDLLFIPSLEEMYPKEATIQLTVTKRVQALCGRQRVGHFDGVATVLTKLFHLTLPDRAYFGMKDAQQVAVIEGFVSDMNFPLDIVGVETIREQDGLAKSSRNVYLNEQERREAPHLYGALLKGKEIIQSGERHANHIISVMTDYITTNTSSKIDYVEVLSYPELESIELLHGKIILAVASKFSSARLIDNIILTV
ncbi:pantoate--beta-alanine ligase [Oikeobacillus pervagus]|uniref:Pantothenate synthetase n=1 Tax=Oikeobacillus pervagus TaxID=1325931 RepID=A0AAJ1T0I4_9BACI|nr:pantoate--beta-alanine ligase [Oikeobacillus pervagus]MDQ0213669.1 pantoate--beta-alanine ligase [Oikeobacillus pervagus]